MLRPNETGRVASLACAVWACVLALPACGGDGGGDEGDDVGQFPPMVDVGLRETGESLRFASVDSAPHLGEVVVYGDAVSVANSNDAIATFRIAGDGGVELATELPPRPRVRATTVAVHEGSGRLFTAAPDRAEAYFDSRGRIARHDGRDPDSVVLEDEDAADADRTIGSLCVVGDTLWIGTLGGGLEARAVDPTDGTLSADPRRAFEGTVDPTGLRVGDHVGLVRGAGEGRLVALVLPDRVAVLDTGDGVADPTVTADVDVDGAPLLDVDSDGRWVAAALGSLGVRVWPMTPSGGLGAPFDLGFRGVTTGVAWHRHDGGGTWLAVSGQSGAWVVDVPDGAAAEADTALLGWVRSRYTMLDVAWHVGADGEAGVVTSDWEVVRRFVVQPGAWIGPPDVERAVVVAAGDDATVRVRDMRRAGDPGEPARIRLVHEWTEEVLAEATLAPGETKALTLGADMLGAAEGNNHHQGWRVPFVVETVGVGFDGLVFGEGRSSWPGVIQITQSVEGQAWQRPPIGAAMPYTHLETMGGAPIELPLAGGGRLAFFGSDCTAVWPMVRDAAALNAAGRWPDGRPWLLVDDRPFDSERYFLQWAFPEGAFAVAADETTTAGPDRELFGSWVYASVFALDNLPGMANHPTNYVYGADGAVDAVSRVYRGLHGWDVGE